MRRIFPVIALFALSLSCSLLIAEGALRWRFGAPVHFVYPQPHYVNDPAIGPWMKPNQQVFNHDKPLTINSVGIRGRDYPRAVPAGTARILAIGDSQTFGNGLALEDTWPKQLESELNRQRGSTNWEILNAGVAGTQTWHHEHIVERLAGVYDFDAVILGFYVNDVAARIEGRDNTERTNTTAKRISYQLKRSALFTALWKACRKFTAPPYWAEREQKILTGEPDAGIEKGWEQVEVSLTAMQRTTDAVHAELVILVVPRRDQVGSAEPIGTAFNDRIAEIGSRIGALVVDPLPALREAYAADGDALFIPWDGHNSALANRTIARQLAQQPLWNTLRSKRAGATGERSS